MYDYFNKRTEPMKSKRNQTIQKLANGTCHRWYRFVLAFPDHYVRDQLSEFGIQKGQIVLDPFVGTGTTCVECKLNGISSIGIDANPIAAFASRVKTTWDLDVSQVINERKRILEEARESSKSLRGKQRNLLDFSTESISDVHREFSLELVSEKYVSPMPLAKCMILREAILRIDDSKMRDFFMLSLATTFVKSANVRFGPEIGLIPPKEDASSLEYFSEITGQMIDDLNLVSKKAKCKCEIIEADSRRIGEILDPDSVSMVITSPPYPVDKDYTRQTRLELAILGLAINIQDIQEIKKKMIRSSTRQIYKADNEVQKVVHITEIRDIIDEIISRCRRDGDTSGFSKMYPRLVGEYFGGMRTHFEQLHPLLKDNAKCAYVVGDSRSFKMVHIQTAKILGIIAEEVGFKVLSIDLWRDRGSTAHKQTLNENILKLQKR